ncbi:MAG: hypothetical protein ABH867_00345 [Patescibacteria group bacterium]|nr:hypothetical protein [Patescibacteria group bacterium]
MAGESLVGSKRLLVLAWDPKRRMEEGKESGKKKLRAGPLTVRSIEGIPPEERIRAAASWKPGGQNWTREKRAGVKILKVWARGSR